jgi:hypothetical protein
VAPASSQFAQGQRDLSGRTEQQASARQAHQLAQGAADVAMPGGDVVGRVLSNLKGTNESSRRIADIIGAIDGIAFQTDILALTAAVEAAQSGARRLDLLNSSRKGRPIRVRRARFSGASRAPFRLGWHLGDTPSGSHCSRLETTFVDAQQQRMRHWNERR